MLITLVVLLAAATVAVPLTRRAGFGSVLGYLLAGLAIGPAGLRLIVDVHQIATVAELGIVMLLFLIGLELRPQRLWVMRRNVFGLGFAQMFGTAAVLAILIHHLVGVPWSAAAILGAGLSLSSTAIVLPMLAERELMTSRAGRDGFAVLLFQDLAFIPLVALAPLLNGGPMPNHIPWLEVGYAVAAVTIILLGGRFLMRPLFRAIGGASAPELFTTTALLIVVGTALLAETAELSASLGAFLAGVLLSDSEYRHELQANIAPFEGLLLGFFFISVGMSVDLGLAMAHPWLLAAATIGLLAVKAALAFALAKAAQRDTINALRFGLALPQASEFGFVLFAAAVAANALPAEHAAFATLVAAASMIATPILFAASERAAIPRLRHQTPPAYDPIEPEGAPVIVCGFGRVGQIVGRILGMHGIAFTALERDHAQVDVVRRFGGKAYYGDPTRIDMLRAAGIEQAKLIVVALDDMEAVLRTVDTVKRNFPQVKIIARARNRRHAHLLMDREVDGLVRDTLHSSLKLGELSLIALGIDQDAAARAVSLFQEHDAGQLAATHAIYRDETQLIQNTQQAADELASLFEADSARRKT